jgi:uncharacterized protein YodC (DUF2158 family)
MSFKPGDRVVHKSDGKPRKMVVVELVRKSQPPKTVHQELANVGRIVEGMYYCTWISGAKKGEGYFAEAELALEPDEPDK